MNSDEYIFSLDGSPVKNAAEVETGRSFRAAGADCLGVDQQNSSAAEQPDTISFQKMARCLRSQASSARGWLRRLFSQGFREAMKTRFHHDSTPTQRRRLWIRGLEIRRCTMRRVHRRSRIDDAFLAPISALLQTVAFLNRTQNFVHPQTLRADRRPLSAKELFGCLRRRIYLAIN